MHTVDRNNFSPYSIGLVGLCGLYEIDIKRKKCYTLAIMRNKVLPLPIRLSLTCTPKEDEKTDGFIRG